jgi:hypothetical protein
MNFCLEKNPGFYTFAFQPKTIHASEGTAKEHSASSLSTFKDLA